VQKGFDTFVSPFILFMRKGIKNSIINQSKLFRFILNLLLDINIKIQTHLELLG